MMTSTPSPKASGIPLSELIDPTHPLVKLTHAIDWDTFSQTFGPLYAEAGRGSVPIRVMVGLHYLKHTFNESDESAVAKWVENPYWQYFCGCETFQHELPCHPTSLVKWRQRVGATRMETLLKSVLQAAVKSQALSAADIKEVTVDTTVQEKAIAFPTDARLYHKARRTLVRVAKDAGIKLRQTYARLSKRLLFQQSRYAAAQQMKRAARQTRKLQVLLGRVIRDVERKCPKPSSELLTILERARRIYTQQRHTSPKLYSLHAPEVECIAKGKVHKKYEFGCKVAVSSTTHSNWLVGIQAHHGNPYDGATLKPALEQVSQLTGVEPKQALVDQGFRGSEHHPHGVTVLIARFTAQVSATVKKLFKRRSAIEPIIGHAQSDHGLTRNYLRGTHGDKINAVLVGCGFNLAKLLRFFAQAQPVWTCV
jgi:IS5 family transposase